MTNSSNKVSIRNWTHSLRQTLRRIAERLGYVRAAETVYLGRKFYYPSDSIIGWQIAGGGEWDSVLRPIVGCLLPGESPVICEVGSNIGASLLQILKAKPGARVIAFEPSTRFLPLLRRNLAGLDNVEIHADLLGREEGEATLFNNASTASAARESYHGHQPRGAQKKVAMTRLDRFCAGRDRLDFLKVDTDGFDFEVLRGAEQSLRRDHPVLFFEFTPEFLMDAAGDLAWLQGLGYERFTCFSARGRLVGTTGDAAEAVRWARADPSEYVDILACAAGSQADGKRDQLHEDLAAEKVSDRDVAA